MLWNHHVSGLETGSHPAPGGFGGIHQRAAAGRPDRQFYARLGEHPLYEDHAPGVSAAHDLPAIVPGVIAQKVQDVMEGGGNGNG